MLRRAAVGAPERTVPAAPVGRVPVYRSAAVSSMEAEKLVRVEFEAVAGRGGRQPQGAEIRTQSRRPISTQSWVLRRSAMLMASQMPTAVSATVKANAAILASMR